MAHRHSGRNRAPPSAGSRLGNFLKQISFGLFVGITAGLTTAGDLRLTPGAKLIVSSLLMVALFCYVLSFIPVTLWLAKSISKNKDKVEMLLWQNLVTAIAAACLVRAALLPLT